MYEFSEVNRLLPHHALSDNGLLELLSDHLPKLFSINIDEQHVIKLVSYNINSRWEFDEYPITESEENKIIRHQALIDFIHQMGVIYDVDLFFLQKAEDQLTNQIQQQIGDDWCIIAQDNNRAIIYKKTVFKAEETQQFNPAMLRLASCRNSDCLAAQLQHVISNKSLALVNICAPLSGDPTTADEAVTLLSQEFSRFDTLLVAGNFNCAIANIDAGLFDNSNSVLPFDSGISNFTDGCFKISQGTIYQLPSDTPSPQNPAQIIKRLPSNIMDNLPYFPVMFPGNHRLPLCGKFSDLDDCIVITVQQLQAEMRKKFQDMSLLICVYTTCLNQKAVIIYSQNPIQSLEDLELKRIADDYYSFVFESSLRESYQLEFSVHVSNEVKQLPLTTITTPSFLKVESEKLFQQELSEIHNIPATVLAKKAELLFKEFYKFKQDVAAIATSNLLKMVEVIRLSKVALKNPLGMDFIRYEQLTSNALESKRSWSKQIGGSMLFFLGAVYCEAAFALSVVLNDANCLLCFHLNSLGLQLQVVGDQLFRVAVSSPLLSSKGFFATSSNQSEQENGFEPLQVVLTTSESLI